ncbi:DUF397 domain-containing protein [Streptomyces sp. ADMS]|uniref:DUF397 domain-containing protein n=1 Tax=Streptomyces sp. ADMS TaxID=3071415 RepID=UPI00296F1ED2|nr:DUF397 domain-containing protein [Streptomyces sp. ADMS]MDW4908575.1 DUF397 domain-containing protein [Streptomyces sp. ADMS]
MSATALNWFKSSHSDSSNPSDCDETATAPGAVHIRDSKATQGPRLTLAPTAWAEFISYASAS